MTNANGDLTSIVPAAPAVARRFPNHRANLLLAARILNRIERFRAVRGPDDSWWQYSVGQIQAALTAAQSTERGR